MNIYTNSNSAFPSQVVSDQEKSTLEYGSQVAMAIENVVGYDGDNYGDMYFQRTLEDWANFDITSRTKYDASISSGLAIMACNKNRYAPVNKKIRTAIDLGIKRYNNKGELSKIIK